MGQCQSSSAAVVIHGGGNRSGERRIENGAFPSKSPSTSSTMQPQTPPFPPSQQQQQPQQPRNLTSSHSFDAAEDASRSAATTDTDGLDAMTTATTTTTTTTTTASASASAAAAAAAAAVVAAVAWASEPNAAQSPSSSSSSSAAAAAASPPPQPQSNPDQSQNEDGGCCVRTSFQSSPRIRSPPSLLPFSNPYQAATGRIFPPSDHRQCFLSPSAMMTMMLQSPRPNPEDDDGYDPLSCTPSPSTNGDDDGDDDGEIRFGPGGAVNKMRSEPSTPSTVDTEPETPNARYLLLPPARSSYDEDDDDDDDERLIVVGVYGGDGRDDGDDDDNREGAQSCCRSEEKVSSEGGGGERRRVDAAPLLFFPEAADTPTGEVSSNDRMVQSSRVATAADAATASRGALPRAGDDVANDDNGEQSDACVDVSFDRRWHSRRQPRPSDGIVTEVSDGNDDIAATASDADGPAPAAAAADDKDEGHGSSHSASPLRSARSIVSKQVSPMTLAIETATAMAMPMMPPSSLPHTLETHRSLHSSDSGTKRDSNRDDDSVPRSEIDTSSPSHRRADAKLRREEKRLRAVLADDASLGSGGYVGGGEGRSKSSYRSRSSRCLRTASAEEGKGSCSPCATLSSSPASFSTPGRRRRPRQTTGSFSNGGGSPDEAGLCVGSPRQLTTSLSPAAERRSLPSPPLVRRRTRSEDNDDDYETAQPVSGLLQRSPSQSEFLVGLIMDGLESILGAGGQINEVQVEDTTNCLRNDVAVNGHSPGSWRKGKSKGVSPRLKLTERGGEQNFGRRSGVGDVIGDGNGKDDFMVNGASSTFPVILPSARDTPHKPPGSRLPLVRDEDAKEDVDEDEEDRDEGHSQDRSNSSSNGVGEADDARLSEQVDFLRSTSTFLLARRGSTGSQSDFPRKDKLSSQRRGRRGHRRLSNPLHSSAVVGGPIGELDGGGDCDSVNNVSIPPSCQLSTVERLCGAGLSSGAGSGPSCPAVVSPYASSQAHFDLDAPNGLRKTDSAPGRATANRASFASSTSGSSSLSGPASIFLVPPNHNPTLPRKISFDESDGGGDGGGREGDGDSVGHVRRGRAVIRFAEEGDVVNVGGDDGNGGAGCAPVRMRSSSPVSMCSVGSGLSRSTLSVRSSVSEQYVTSRGVLRPSEGVGRRQRQRHRQRQQQQQQRPSNHQPRTAAAAAASQTPTSASDSALSRSDSALDPAVLSQFDALKLRVERSRRVAARSDMKRKKKEKRDDHRRNRKLLQELDGIHESVDRWKKEREEELWRQQQLKGVRCEEDVSPRKKKRFKTKDVESKGSPECEETSRESFQLFDSGCWYVNFEALDDPEEPLEPLLKPFFVDKSKTELYLSSKPDLTHKPDQTHKPEQTPKPDQTRKPDQMLKSDQTLTPDKIDKTPKVHSNVKEEGVSLPSFLKKLSSSDLKVSAGSLEASQPDIVGGGERQHCDANDDDKSTASGSTYSSWSSGGGKILKPLLRQLLRSKKKKGDKKIGGGDQKSKANASEVSQKVGPDECKEEICAVGDEGSVLDDSGDSTEDEVERAAVRPSTLLAPSHGLMLSVVEEADREDDSTVRSERSTSSSQASLPATNAPPLLPAMKCLNLDDVGSCLSGDDSLDDKRYAELLEESADQITGPFVI